MNLQIHALSPNRLEDYLDLFEHRAFCDNPAWAGCYCVFNHFAGSDEAWMQRTAEENRSDAIRMIQSGALCGYLAYDGDIPVGWCNVNGKAAFTRYAALNTPHNENIRVCAITCFVIAPDYRRRGIARALLNRACRDYAAKGYDIMEAYPVLTADTCAAHYHGHPAMFTAAGFHLCKEFDGFGCMQKSLKEKTHES